MHRVLDELFLDESMIVEDEDGHPKLQRTAGGFKPAADLFTIYQITMMALNLRKVPKEKYYWYQKGFWPTRFVTLIVYLTFNIYQDIDIINPIKPWNRYKDLWFSD